MTEPVELHLERLLDQPYDELERALRAGEEGWLPGYRGGGERPTAEIGVSEAGRRIRRRIELDLGPVQRFAYGVTIRIGWRAEQRPELYPTLEGHLRLERNGSGASLRLAARYRPPGGRLGASIDRAVLHRVAESSVEDFLDGVAGRLAATAGSS